jgi:mannose-6-phosphate isomerase-like protein (cupin superfamily)
MAPGGGPPVMHRHAPGEVYHVTEGEFTFYVADAPGPGDAVPLAGNTPHTVRNESTADAVAFVVHAPGAPMEGFARAAADMEAVLQVAAANGIELLGPIG